MKDIELYNFINDNDLDAIEGVLTTVNSEFGEKEEFKKNFYIIVGLLNEYFRQNNCNDKLDFFLSDIATINYLKDKDLVSFLMSIINVDNKFDLDFNYELEDIKLLLETSKAYLNTKRSNYRVLDNNFLSILIDLYANCCSEINPEIKQLFFLVLYNNYSNMQIEDLDYFELELTKIYYNFISNPIYQNLDLSNLEDAYKEITKYLGNYLNISVKGKVK